MLRTATAIAVAIALVLLCACAPPTAEVLEIHVLDVGNADCILIRQGDAAMLIDAGEADDADKIVSYLHSHGVERLMYILETHPHADHIGGMQRVVEAYAVDSYLHITLPAWLDTSSVMRERLEEALTRRNVPRYDVSGGMTLMLGTAQVEIYPTAAEYENANDYSAVCRVTFGERRFLFMADAESDSMRALLDSGVDLSADVIKLGHHGGKAEATADFLEEVGAETALITCGVENDYGHPHEATLAVLEERGMTVRRSDVHGNIVITTNGTEDTFNVSSA